MYLPHEVFLIFCRFKTEQTHLTLYMTAIASLSTLVGKPIIKVSPENGLNVKISGSSLTGNHPTTLSPSTLVLDWNCNSFCYLSFSIVPLTFCFYKFCNLFSFSKVRNLGRLRMKSMSPSQWMVMILFSFSSQNTVVSLLHPWLDHPHGILSDTIQTLFFRKLFQNTAKVLKEDQRKDGLYLEYSPACTKISLSESQTPCSRRMSVANCVLVCCF